MSHKSEMAKIIEAKLGLCVIAKLQLVNEELGLPEKCPKQGLMGHPVHCHCLFVFGVH